MISLAQPLVLIYNPDFLGIFEHVEENLRDVADRSITCGRAVRVNDVLVAPTVVEAKFREFPRSAFMRGVHQWRFSCVCGVNFFDCSIHPEQALAASHFALLDESSEAGTHNVVISKEGFDDLTVVISRDANQRESLFSVRSGASLVNASEVLLTGFELLLFHNVMDQLHFEMPAKFIDHGPKIKLDLGKPAMSSFIHFDLELLSLGLASPVDVGVFIRATQRSSFYIDDDNNFCVGEVLYD